MSLIACILNGQIEIARDSANVRFCLEARLDDCRIVRTGAFQALDTRQLS